MQWKIKILFLALAAMVSRPFLRLLRVRASSRVVAVIQMGKMGDMICTTPVFRALKEHGFEVLVVGNRANKELLAGHQFVDRYIVYERNSMSVIRELRTLAPHAVLLSGPSPDVLEIGLLSYAPLVVAPTVTGGYCPFETRLYRILSRFAASVPHRMGSYAPREYLRILEPIGIYVEDTTKYVTLSESGRVQAREKIRSLGVPEGASLVGIFPSTGYAIKLWPLASFEKMIRELRKHRPDVEIILLGSESDRPRVGELLARVHDLTRVHSLAGTHSLDTFTGIISELSVYVSVDTGPVYIAEALGVPTVTIVGPMDEREQPPLGRIHRLVWWKERKAPAIHIMNNLVFDPVEVKRQTENCTPEAVLHETLELLTLHNLKAEKETVSV